MSEIITTKQKHSENGTYSEARASLHTDIIKSLMVGEPATESLAVLLGGGSGVGKTLYRRTILVKAFHDAGESVVTIDSDGIKELLPEYQELVSSTEHWASILHDESSDIADNLLRLCIKENRNFIYDGTMKNDAKYKNIIETLKSRSYSIEIVVVDVPLEEAFARAETRFILEKRRVPDEIIVESHSKVAQTFYILKDIVENYRMVDTSGIEPKVFAEKYENVEDIKEPERVKAFFLKGDIIFE